MRSAIFAFSVFAAVVTITGCADDKPTVTATPSHADAAQKSEPSGPGGQLTVQAGTGTERFPVPGVAVRVTSCENDSELATITTGKDGNASQQVSAGCYRATVTTVPSGCQPDAVASETADIKVDEPATVKFLIHCA
ncbi:hypothetical protein ACWDSJ_06090 [Nocardia sp. NPDC003482]|uniref:hypothetical protein n=1 Tax=Nocardia sp. NPDC004068 TaxID=3364303 RepID=UPI0036AB6D9F